MMTSVSPPSNVPTAIPAVSVLVPVVECYGYCHLFILFSTSIHTLHLAVCMFVLCSLPCTDLLVGCVEGDVVIVVEGVDVL